MSAFKMAGIGRNPSADAFFLCLFHSFFCFRYAYGQTSYEVIDMIPKILELLILPPLAIGRCGSSADPMDNYEAVPDANTPSAYRALVPAETLIVDTATGRITGATTPAAVQFRDDAGRIRPVAPFFEIWAQFVGADQFVPLTVNHLTQWNLTPTDIQWRVQVGNHKASRRTNAPNDNIDADTGLFSDSAARSLSGNAQNFVADAVIPLGTVQYIEPTDAFPELRLRFTPAAGNIYGPTLAIGAVPDPNVAAQVYNSSSGGTWPGHSDNTESLSSPTPPANYAFVTGGGSRGYLDDTCDGLIEAQLTVAGTTFTAYARIAVGPPDFAPDSFHVRTLADELEQILLGPQVTEAVAASDIIDLIRRSMETLRLMNTAQLNAQTNPNAFAHGADYNVTMQMHATLMGTLSGLNAAAGSPEHQAALTTLSGIAARTRSYLNTGVFTSQGRQQMPALMHGADDRLLALTRRQQSKLMQGVGSRE
jgi:hypothetical protein